MRVDESVLVLQALLDHIGALPERVGPDWERVRPKLFELVEVWLRGDEDPSALAGQVLAVLGRYPEAIELLAPSIVPVALESMVPKHRAFNFGIPLPIRLDASASRAPEPERPITQLAERLRDALVDPSSVHLNAWFPGHATEASLVVGTASKLCVNLGPRRDDGATAAVADASRFDTVDHVYVVVRCASAYIKPAMARLAMPPRADRVAEFSLTPFKPGPMRIAVVVLVQNDPVERLEFSADARDEVAP